PPGDGNGMERNGDPGQMSLEISLPRQDHLDLMPARHQPSGGFYETALGPVQIGGVGDPGDPHAVPRRLRLAGPQIDIPDLRDPVRANKGKGFLQGPPPPSEVVQHPDLAKPEVP